MHILEFFRWGMPYVDDDVTDASASPAWGSANCNPRLVARILASPGDSEAEETEAGVAVLHAYDRHLGYAGSEDRLSRLHSC